MSRTATGRLVFSKAMNKGVARPLHNMKIKLYDEDVVTRPDFLAEATTDKDGNFSFTYNPEDAGMMDTPDLKLMVYEHEPYYDAKGELVVKEVPVRSFIPEVHNDVSDNKYDFGEVEVKYWEYQPQADSYTPRLYINEKEGYPLMQEQRPGRNRTEYMMYAKDAVRVLTKFPKTKMQKLEEKYPGAAFGDDATVDLMLNGFNPCIPQRAADGRLYVEFKYDGIALDFGFYAPNSRAYFKQDKESGKLTLDTIELTERIGGYTRGWMAVYGKPKVYSAADGEEVWNKVKRIWRVNYFLFGEVVTHLGGTHLNVEQYIVPMMRNVRLNPIYNLLFPHFYGTVAINHGADGLLTGGTALVPQGSPVTKDSVATAARSGFPSMNWAGFTPRAPLCKDHVFAELQQEFWSVLTQYVDEYVAEHEEGIVSQWREIYLWSEELVQNSVPYSPQPDNYYDMGEINSVEKAHPEVDAWTASVSPITVDEELTAENKEQNLANLKQLCRYLLLTTTFKHGWVNDTQYDIGGWPEYATLGLDHDILDPKNDGKDPVKPAIKFKHIVTTYTLANIKWGYILKNEAHDMHPRLVELLREKQRSFETKNYDVENTRCCINI